MWLGCCSCDVVQLLFMAFVRCSSLWSGSVALHVVCIYRVTHLTTSKHSNLAIHHHVISKLYVSIPARLRDDLTLTLTDCHSSCGQAHS